MLKKKLSTLTIKPAMLEVAKPTAKAGEREMIKVDTYKYIKEQHIRERKSIRQISRETGLARQTIRKILYGSVEEVTKYKRKIEPPYFLASEMARGCKLSGVKKIRVHDIRHSHTSLLIELGFSPLLLSERLGHESVETTLQTYAHLYPNKHGEVAENWMPSILQKMAPNQIKIPKNRNNVAILLPRPIIKACKPFIYLGYRLFLSYSHSMVAGGLEVIS
ncbi:MAG: tyrosine-type recombinase/integrase [Desulfurispora sp.]|uniref:tyrosine-type recombinase/integrase n=1 Tax=Desulfurispora sp. TaxID=3014275 RepID=UPI00404AE22D